MSQKTSTDDKIFKSKFPYTIPDNDANVGTYLLESFEYHRERTLLVDCTSKREWTGDQLKNATMRVASGLMDNYGIKKGDVIYMMCPHSDHEIIFCLGALLTGATIFGATPRDGYGEHRTMCKIVRPSVFVASYRMHHEMIQLAKDVQGDNPSSGLAKIIWIDTSERPIEDDSYDHSSFDSNNNNNNNDNNNNNSPDYEELLERDNVIIYYDDLLDYKYIHLDKINDMLENQIDSHRDAAFFLLTSGSTGKPKVVHQTHYTIVAAAHGTMTNPRTKNQLKQLNVMTKTQSKGNCTSITDHNDIWHLDENSVVAGDLPLDHGAGQNSIFLSMHKGCKLAIMRSYDMDIFWKNVSDFRITDCMASATFAHRLLLRFNIQIAKGDKLYNSLDITSLRTLFFCGSRIGSLELCEEFMRDHPHLAILQGYGCTEAGFISLLVRGHHVGHLDSVGWLAPGIRAKLVDPETGKLLGKNETGELFVKCEACFLRYYGGEEMLKATELVYDPDRFYRTGDQCYFDDDERLYVIGRYKDTLFLDEDWKILPKELEDIVEQHNLVEHCVVVGLPDPDLPSCHLPKAFVKLTRGSRGYCTELGESKGDVAGGTDGGSTTFNYVSDKDIFDFVAARVAKPKYLRGGVRFLEEWPRNGLLRKIDRKQLRLMP